MVNPSPPILDPFWPKDTLSPIPTRIWATIVQRDGPDLQSQSLRYSLQLFVTEVKHCKAGERFKHEFLIISLVYRPEGRTVDILTERAQNALTSHTLNPSAGSSALSSGLTAADDRVFTCAKGERSGIDRFARKTYGSYKIISTLKPLRDVSAAQLSVLLTAPRDTEPNYHPLTHQCYWYAETVYDAIEYLSSGKPLQKQALGRIVDQYNKDWNELRSRYPQIMG